MKSRKKTVVEKVTFMKGKRRFTLPLRKCACGYPAKVESEGPFTIIHCIKCSNQMKIIGRERAFRYWNKRQEKAEEKSSVNSSGAVSSGFGKDKTEVEKDFNKKSVRAPKGVEAIDRVDDRKVGLAEWVEVIDAKYANTIGWRKQDEVFDLVQTDERFRGNVTEDGTFQLFYNPNWATGNFTEVNCTSLEQYIGCIKNGKDVIACDDPVRLMLQASYLLGGSKYVATLSLTYLKNAIELKLVTPALAKAIGKHYTQGIIDYLRIG